MVLVAVRLHELSDGREIFQRGKASVSCDLRRLIGRSTSSVYQAFEEGLFPEEKDQIGQRGIEVLRTHQDRWIGTYDLSDRS